MDGHPISPDETWVLSGVEGAEVDAIYLGPETRRVETDVPMPYITSAQDGETHVQFVIRAPDDPNAQDALYID